MIAGFFVWLTIILPYNFERGKSAFESEEILTYYEESSFNQIGAFLVSRRDKLEAVKSTYFRGGLEIWLRSLDYKEDSLFGRSYIRIVDGETAHIHNGALNIVSDEGVRTLESDWLTYITINNIRDIHESVFQYLETSPKELDFVLRNVADQHLRLSNSETSSEIFFRHYYGHYEIHFTAELDTSKTLIKELESGVFLTNRN